jgi:thymidylate synthase (FAD)
MKVKLIHYTPLWVCSSAVRKCWASEDKSDTYLGAKCRCCEHIYIQDEEQTLDCPKCECDEYVFVRTCGEKDKELIYRVGNKFKHASTLEHLVYTFDVAGISRACLQELARHRIASYSVKSTRYTLKELKDDDGIYDVDNFCCGVNYTNYCTVIDNFGDADIHTSQQLQRLAWQLRKGMSNDKAKYMLPENFKTSLVMTINARSLQNFLSLRTASSALLEIQQLAHAIYEQIPSEHKYLFEEHIHG